MNQLRFLAIVTLLLAVFSLPACDKDDDSTNDSIVGTWEHVESMEGFSMTVTMTFNADYTGISKIVLVIAGESDTETTGFTYSINGSLLTLIESGESSILTFSISGNKLTLTEDGENIVFTRK